MIGCHWRFGRKPFVKGDGEGEELFPCRSMDHLDVDLGALEGRIVEVFDVIEEVTGNCGMRGDRGGLKAEVLIVLGDLLVDGRMVNGERDQRDFASLGVFGGEEAAVDVVEGSGGKLVVIRGDELHPGFVEIEGRVAVVSDDDADRDEGVPDVRKSKEVAIMGISAGINSDGDVFLRVGVEGGVVTGGTRGRGLFIAGVSGGQGQSHEREEQQ